MYRPAHTVGISSRGVCSRPPTRREAAGHFNGCGSEGGIKVFKMSRGVLKMSR